MKPLPRLSRNKNLQINRKNLDSLGLPGVASTLIEPETQGQGLLKVVKLRPLSIKPLAYEEKTNSKNKPVIGVETADTFRYLFVQYENAYIPAGDEKLYSFAVVLPLQPMTVNECAIQLGVLVKNVIGLSQSQYENNSFNHPVYTNQNNLPLSVRYVEVPVVVQTIPGRLDNVPLGYPNFLTSRSPITEQQGYLPSPPAPDFITSEGNTGATAIGIGGTVHLIDASAPIYLWKPTSWNWSFSPSAGASAGPTGLTAQNPIVTFNIAGSYTVTLTAANSSGSNAITKLNFVTVT